MCIRDRLGHLGHRRHRHGHRRRLEIQDNHSRQLRIRPHDREKRARLERRRFGPLHATQAFAVRPAGGTAGTRAEQPSRLVAEEVSRLPKEMCIRDRIDLVAAAPIDRHPVAEMLRGAWTRRTQLRLADALYVELAVRLGVPLVTTDAALGRAASVAEVISA